MDRFWCSRCLNDRIEVPDMMRLFAGGATTPLVVKIWTKQPWFEIENLHNFDYYFALSRGKILLWLFYTFLLRSHVIPQKYQVISLKNKCQTSFFVISYLSVIFRDPLTIWPITDIFQSWRCLLKHFDKILQSTMLKFIKKTRN